MTNFGRILSVALVSLLIFLAAGLLARAWLGQQTRRMQVQAIAAKRAELTRLLGLGDRQPATWDARYRDEIGALLGGRLEFYRGAPPAAEAGELGLNFPDLAPGLNARLTFSPSPAELALELHERAMVLLLLLALALFLLTTAVAVAGWLRPAEHTTGPPARAEIDSLARLAQTSVAQGTQLARERDERRRAEEDLQLNQTRLGRAQEEKIRLGRDLHDGIIQSLYATGLTLESARALLRTDAAAAEQRLDTARATLNAVIREVRAHIMDLEPDRLQQADFARTLGALAEELRGDRAVKIDLQIDGDAAALLSPEQNAAVLQITREAISNSLRHGRATSVAIRLHRGERELGLLVQDNGAGFDPAATHAAGHGLKNMRARAEGLGAVLRVTSRPGAGTRLVANIPILPAA